MSLSPEDAAKILEADLRNVIAKVGNGGVLTRAERELFTAYLRDTQAKEAAAAQPQAAPAETPTPQARAPDPPEPQAPPPAPAKPQAETIPEVVRAEHLTAWAAVYDTQGRQLRRWIAAGRQANDIPPLNSPALMPAWWDRMRLVADPEIRFKHRCPPNVLAAAAKAGPPPETPAPSAATPTPEVTGPMSELVADAEEGAEVQYARNWVITCAVSRENAHRNNKPTEVAAWSREFRDAMETYRKHKAEDREDRKGRRLLLSRAEVELQHFEALKVLVGMHNAMARRLVEAVRKAWPEISEDQLALVLRTVEEVRADELTIFRNLKVMRKPEDVL